MQLSCSSEGLGVRKKNEPKNTATCCIQNHSNPQLSLYSQLSLASRGSICVPSDSGKFLHFDNMSLFHVVYIAHNISHGVHSAVATFCISWDVRKLRGFTGSAVTEDSTDTLLYPENASTCTVLTIDIFRTSGK